MGRSFVFALVTLSIWTSMSRAQGTASYAPLKEIPIGGPGGGDYLSIDPEAHRLYVSHSTRVIVIDTEHDTVVGEIADTPGVHGVAIAADLGRGFSTNGREDKVSIIDLKTLKTLQKVATGATPDAVLYDPSTQEVYTMNGRGQSATVINARSGEVVATIPLEESPNPRQSMRGHTGSSSTLRTKIRSPSWIPARTRWWRTGRLRPVRKQPGWRSTPQLTGSSWVAATS